MLYYLIVAAVPILTCSLVYALYKIIALQNLQSKRIELLLKASYTCVNSLKPVKEKIEDLQQDSIAALENQKKSYQHLRVLLASLNTQIKQLDKSLKPSSIENIDQSLNPEAEEKLKNANALNSSGEAISRLLKKPYNIAAEGQTATVKLEDVLGVRRGPRNEAKMENASNVRRVING